MTTPDSESAPAVILFDGVCNLCNGFVNFIIDHDPAGTFQFAALQSDAAQEMLQRHGVTIGADNDKTLLQSVVLIEDGAVYRRSTAALRIARHLEGAWSLLYAFIMVPRAVRDAVYDWIATRRYDWFGRRATCRVPTPAMHDRFLDASAPEGAAVDDDRPPA